jgi:hypothetical protein
MNAYSLVQVLPAATSPPPPSTSLSHGFFRVCLWRASWIRTRKIRWHTTFQSILPTSPLSRETVHPTICTHAAQPCGRTPAPYVLKDDNCWKKDLSPSTWLFCSAANLARELSANSTVLLKNEGDVLPLTAATKVRVPSGIARGSGHALSANTTLKLSTSLFQETSSFLSQQSEKQTCLIYLPFASLASCASARFPPVSEEGLLCAGCPGAQRLLLSDWPIRATRSLTAAAVARSRRLGL